jgi:hypothetical protein
MAVVAKADTESLGHLGIGPGKRAIWGGREGICMRQAIPVPHKQLSHGVWL